MVRNQNKCCKDVGNPFLKKQELKKYSLQKAIHNVLTKTLEKRKLVAFKI